MENQESKIIEINGIKMEVDLRTAKMKRVDTFKVGDAVKLLYKQYDHSSPEVKTAIIVAFDEFQALPTITVAFIDYSSLKFAYINSSTKHEIIAASEHDLNWDKDWILRKMDQDIKETEQKALDAKRMKEMFIQHFGKYMDLSAESAQ